MRDHWGLAFRYVLAWGIAISFGAALPALGEAPADESARVSFPTYGLSFVPPPGWKAEPWPSVPNVMTYSQVDKDHHILAALTVQVNETPPFEKHKLDEFALTRGADVLVQTFSIDSAPTTAIRKAHGDEKNGTFLLLVTDHDTRSYSFSVSAPNDALPTHELIALVKTAKWIPVEDPLDHVTPTKTAPLFDGVAEIQLPAIFRRLSGIKQKNVAAYMATDAASKQAAVVSFRFVPADADNPGIPDDTQVLVVRHTVLEAAQKQWGLNDFPLMDVKNPFTNGVATVPTVVSSLSSDAHMLTATSRYGAIFAQPGITYVELQSFGEPGDRATKWDRVLLDVANSLKFTAASTSQPASQPAAR